MKMILDIDDQIVKDMQDFCAYHNLSINTLIEDLFTRYVKEPAISLSELNDKKEFWEFYSLLNEYLNEAVSDLHFLSNSEEAFETDEAMAKVFKQLIEKHIQQAFVVTDLYGVYKKEISKLKENK